MTPFGFPFDLAMLIGLALTVIQFAMLLRRGKQQGHAETPEAKGGGTNK